MKEAGFDFRIENPGADESFPHHLPVEVVPSYLAEKKAKVFETRIKQEEIVITADTVVILTSQILNKPADRDEAFEMLSKLSGKTHMVITAVCLYSLDKTDCFDDRTRVTFKNLTDEEIDYYIDRCKPYDKAGSYGAQDWLGMVGIEKINGSYFTVMGMPMHKVYQHLKEF
jgi:septum formation protein